MSVERNSNPIVGSEINLKLVLFNSNAPANVYSVDKVEIYKLGEDCIENCNPDGRILVETITDISNDNVGIYNILVEANSPAYTIGEYVDKWLVRYESIDVEPVAIENRFKIYPSLWFSSTSEVLLSPTFSFTPNRIRKGSIKWIAIKVIPQVARGSDLERYYTNLITSSNLYVYFEKDCSVCPSDDCGDDLILDSVKVENRDRCYGFYKLNTTDEGDNALDLDEAIYSIWFKLEQGNGDIDISDKFQIQIY